MPVTVTAPRGLKIGLIWFLAGSFVLVPIHSVIIAWPFSCNLRQAACWQGGLEALTLLVCFVDKFYSIFFCPPLCHEKISD